MEQARTRADNLSLLGERLCLDFANTADWHASDQPVEYLTSYPELVAWSRHVGILAESRGGRLLELATQSPIEAKAVLARAVRLREAIYGIFAAVARGMEPPAKDLAALNAELSAALAHAQVVPSDEGFAWDWTAVDALDQMLWPVVQDAADLLTAGDLRRVGQCADDRCGWLFFDTSRNHSRRWCSMKDCGNRAKARRHYQRTATSQDPQ